MRTTKMFILLLAVVMAATGCTILAAMQEQGETTAVVTPAQPVQTTAQATPAEPVSMSQTTSSEASTEALVSSKDPSEAEPSMEQGVYKDGMEMWIEVDQGTQRVYIHHGDKVIKRFIVSTGRDEADARTPNGTFYIQNRDTWFFSPKYQQGGMYWVSFLNWGEYLFHSVPMTEDQQIIVEEAEKLGQKASHGCVRLSVEDAKWIYDNIEAGTRVVIHD